jgi:hypothetical protein
VSNSPVNKERGHILTKFSDYKILLTFGAISCKMKQNNINILVAISLVAFATVMRVLNAEMHLYNFVPMAALGVFSGSALGSRKALAFMVPLAGQLMADVFFQLFTSTPGFYPGQVFNYAALAATAGLGLFMKQPKPLSALAFVFGGSALFFIISNFGYFMSGYNGYTLAGFTKTYIDAVPFYRNTIAGDMVGGVVLFGTWFAAQNVISRRLSNAKA